MVYKWDQLNTMKVSAFTFIKNGQMLGYPFIQSIKSILSIVDEFVINVGDSEDNTLELIESLNNPKIHLFLYLNSRLDSIDLEQPFFHKTYLQGLELLVYPHQTPNTLQDHIFQTHQLRF